MSNEFAISAVTLTLRNLLDKVKSIKDGDEFLLLPADAKPTNEILVTNLPLDKASESDKAKNYVNLFCYHLEQNATWNNMDMPDRVKPGETGYPPLAMNLYYIITAYGQNGNELIGHVLLGKAMSLLHNHPVFSRDEIESSFAVSKLHEQIERLRITHQPISAEEVSKLWTGFQTQYRLSASYEVSVALIDSKRPAKTPLPVLTRGPADEGVFVEPSLIPPFPTIETVTAPNDQPGARLGEALTITGHQLGGDSVVIRLTHPQLSAAIDVAPLVGATEAQIEVQLPNDPANWPVGLYTIVAVISKMGEQDRTTNGIGVLLVPSIVTVAFGPLPVPVVGGYTATVTCNPQILPAQSADLLLGDRQFAANNHPTKTDTLTFSLLDVANGDYYIRLRIDGVDSLLIDRSVSPPVFDASQKVTIP